MSYADKMVITSSGVERRSLTNEEVAQRETDRAAAEAAEAAEAERAAEPSAQDVLDAIAELAAEGADVERRIHERAAAKAQERAQGPPS